MAMKDYENKKVTKQVVETKKLRQWSFPNEGVVVEAETYQEAVEKMQDLAPKKD